MSLKRSFGFLRKNFNYRDLLRRKNRERVEGGKKRYGTEREGITGAEGKMKPLRGSRCGRAHV